MGNCDICGKSVEYPGSTQHGKKHRKEFEEETGYSKHTDYQIIKAYYGADCRKWAKEIVNELKDAGKIPKNENLQDFP